MTTEELHYQFRQEWDKNANQHRRGLSDLEIDRLFNRVIIDYVDIFATGKNPRNYNVGFEVTQQMIDMVSSLVRSYPEQSELVPVDQGEGIYTVDFSDLDKKYRHHVSSSLNTSDCGVVGISIEKHAELDAITSDAYRKANKRWKNVPATIRNNKMYLYTDSVFTPTGVRVTYVKVPDPVSLGTYTVAPTVDNPNPTTLATYSSTDINENYHYLLVTMAVQEAARIYGDQFQVAAQTNKLTELT